MLLEVLILPIRSKGVMLSSSSRYEMFARVVLLLVVLGLAGCNRSGPTQSVDANAAADRAIETYDANGDGELGGEELESSPALKSAMDRFDTNNNGKLSATEIADRLNAYKSQSSTVPVSIRVRLGRNPLKEATVEFSNEPFLVTQPSIYSGVSDSLGTVRLAGEGGPVLGLPVGLYQVKITRSGGQEYIRGVEIADDAPDPARMVFSL